MKGTRGRRHRHGKNGAHRGGSAISLIDRHGEDAGLEAAMRAVKLLAAGDMDGKRADTLRAIMDLRMRIANVRAKTLEDAAVQLRRLDAMAGDDDPEMALLVMSVLAVVERAVA